MLATAGGAGVAAKLGVGERYSSSVVADRGSAAARAAAAAWEPGGETGSGREARGAPAAGMGMRLGSRASDLDDFNEGDAVVDGPVLGPTARP